jgi:hypothetical protein
MKRALLVWVCVVIMIVSGSAQSGEATLNAAIISAPRPDYPEQASVRHVAGCGLYQIDIDAKTGVPLRVEILQSAAHPVAKPRGSKRSHAMARQAWWRARCEDPRLLRASGRKTSGDIWKLLDLTKRSSEHQPAILKTFSAQPQERVKPEPPWP